VLAHVVAAALHVRHGVLIFGVDGAALRARVPAPVAGHSAKHAQPAARVEARFADLRRRGVLRYTFNFKSKGLRNQDITFQVQGLKWNQAVSSSYA
jgi:hypothetical protein